jgi:hypothetical protein
MAAKSRCGRPHAARTIAGTAGRFICASACRSSGESNSHDGCGTISLACGVQVRQSASPRRARSPVRHAGHAVTAGIPEPPPAGTSRDGLRLQPADRPAMSPAPTRASAAGRDRPAVLPPAASCRRSRGAASHAATGCPPSTRIRLETPPATLPAPPATSAAASACAPAASQPPLRLPHRSLRAPGRPAVPADQARLGHDARIDRSQLYSSPSACSPAQGVRTQEPRQGTHQGRSVAV